MIIHQDPVNAMKFEFNRTVRLWRTSVQLAESFQSELQIRNFSNLGGERVGANLLLLQELLGLFKLRLEEIRLVLVGPVSGRMERADRLMSSPLRRKSKGDFVNSLLFSEDRTGGEFPSPRDCESYLASLFAEIDRNLADKLRDSLKVSSRG